MAGSNRLKLLSCETDYRLKIHPFILRKYDSVIRLFYCGARGRAFGRLVSCSCRPVASAERVTFSPPKTNRAETERNTHSKIATDWYKFELFSP